MPEMTGSIVWFRLDLRLADNPALLAAARCGGPVIPVFIWAPEEEGNWPPGAASRWWLHQSLRQLDASLRQLGSRLIIRRGPTLDAIRDLLQTTGSGAVFWNRRYEPAAIERDSRVKAFLQKGGWTAESFNGSLLFEPWTIHTQQSQPYQVFTPFWKACLPQPAPEPEEIEPTHLEDRAAGLRHSNLPSWGWNRQSTGPRACNCGGAPVRVERTNSSSAFSTKR